MFQLVALPRVAINGVIGGMVFLNLTPGEVVLYGRTLERRERSSTEPIKTRGARPALVPQTT